MISLVRVDDRLVHGQVVEGWMPVLRAEAILVISDQAAEDSTQEALMRLALPESVRLSVRSVAQGVAAYREASEEKASVLVLTPSPAEVLALVTGGADIETVNIGGLHFAAGRVQLGKAIFLNHDDRRALQALAERGVRLEGRAVPNDRKMDVAAMIEEKV
jgi:mannose/fructose/N-acetylgalactosamine-specific phosphotransferase system component IIB